jgi:5'-methylthioadenosine phosphorylase
MPRIGVIGGSGLYSMDGLSNMQHIKMDTPFGDPSDALLLGEIGGREIVFLSRHGKGHGKMPSEVNNRANIYALKQLGVAWIISVSAVGSLKPEIRPLDIVIIDQFFDRTNQARGHTFFGNGIVAHIAFAHPVCRSLADILYDAGKKIGAPMKKDGTYINVEGPAFSTLAESKIYQSWGVDVIGMTNMNEARLAREAEICYATMAMVTDYDCWYEEETGMTVSVEAVIEYQQKNADAAKNIIKTAIQSIPLEQKCDCADALATAIITNRNAWPAETIDRLGPIIQKYL